MKTEHDDQTHDHPIPVFLMVACIGRARNAYNAPNDVLSELSAQRATTKRPVTST